MIQNKNLFVRIVRTKQILRHFFKDTRGKIVNQRKKEGKFLDCSILISILHIYNYSIFRPSLKTVVINEIPNNMDNKLAEDSGQAINLLYM